MPVLDILGRWTDRAEMRLAVDLLHEARAKIEKRERWAANLDELFTAPGPGRECLLTAIPKDALRSVYGLLQEAMIKRAPEYAGLTLGKYNDTHSHDEVLSLYDEAIALAESRC